MAAGKVNPSSGISAYNNPSRSAEGRGPQTPAASSAADTASSTSSGNSAATYQGRRYEPLEERDIDAMLSLLRDSNGQIGETSDALRSQRHGGSPVPSVLGYTVPAATDKLRSAGLQVERADWQPHPHIPVGRIIGQSPAPGAMADLAGMVRLVVSKGPG